MIFMSQALFQFAEAQFAKAQFAKAACQGATCLGMPPEEVTPRRLSQGCHRRT
jgi:hypothetical protein